MILRVCNVDFGNNFTSLPSLPCQYQKILNLISLPKISQDSIKNWAIFYQFVGNFKRGRLLDRGLYYSKYGTYVFRSLDMKVMTISKFKFWCQWGWCAHVSLAITNMGIATIFSFLCCLEVKISARNTFWMVAILKFKMAALIKVTLFHFFDAGFDCVQKGLLANNFIKLISNL